MAIKRPTTTPLPDEISDWWMAELSCAELKCLIYIVRHTFGYGKNITGDAISLDQFQHGIRRKEDGAIIDRGTGLGSRSSITTALNGLVAKGLVKRTRRTSMSGDADSTVYVLDLDDEQAWPHPALSVAAGGSPESGPPPTHGSTKTGLPPGEGGPKNGPPGAETGPSAPGGGPKNGRQVVQKLDPQQTTLQEVPPVPRTPVDISTKVDNSARNARAREAPDEQSIPRTTLDPRPDWVPAVTQQIQEHWGGNLLASEREEWREWVWENLRGEDQSNRARFLAYAFDNNRIPQLSSPRGVLTFLSKDLDSWRRSNRPTAKGLRRVEGGGSAARVPAHIQREHDQAYKPPQYSPESIARHLATIRKYKDEECAQRWLAENGLTETGT